MKKLGLRWLQALETMCDIMLAGLYFVLCSIPIVTIGASATAMHYALRQHHDDNGSLTKDFFASFKRNFRQATVIWLMLLAAAAIVLGNYWLLQDWENSATPIILAAMAVMSLLILVETVMVFPMLARFDNSIGGLMKNSLILAMLHPVRTAALAVITVLPVAVSVLLPELFSAVVAMWALGLCGGSAYLAQLLIIPMYNAIENSADSQEGM